MKYMFYDCSALQYLDLTNFNTSNVGNMYCMFYGCSSLTEIIGLTNFNTAKVGNMFGMFRECSNLTEIDISNFETSNVWNMGTMFNDCSNLTTIYVGEGWNTDYETYDTTMFEDCYKLVGGEGTAYNYNHEGKDYARVDGGTTSPGYLTLKTICLFFVWILQNVAFYSKFLHIILYGSFFPRA